MRLARIAIVVLLGIVLVSTVACDSSSTSNPTATPVNTLGPTSNATPASTFANTPTSTPKAASRVLCFEGCPLWWVGDGECDSGCNIEQCNWDDGDCTPPTPLPTPTPTPTPVQTPTGAQRYDQDRAAIQAAVDDYHSDHDQEIPYLQDPGEIEGQIVWIETPMGSCCPVDMCKLVPDYLLSIPLSCSDRTSINDVDNCGVLEGVYYGCSGCHTSSHYMWVMTASGEISSVYYDIPGDSWAAPIIQDGYQGVYP